MPTQQSHRDTGVQSGSSKLDETRSEIETEARSVAQDAKSAARDAAEAARDTAQQKAEGAKQSVAREVDDVASALRKAAGEARGKALAAFLAYRRDGGENHSDAGRLCLAVGQAMRQGDTWEAQRLIEIELADETWGEHMPFVHKLQAIISGERDLVLAEDEALHYQYAAELTLLLEGLGA